MTSRVSTTAVLKNAKNIFVGSVVSAKIITYYSLLVALELIKTVWHAQIAIQTYSIKLFIGIVNNV
jgi:hypothetical protein